MHIYIYIHTDLPIEGYGDATSHRITETKSHATFFLLRSDVGIHEAGFQDPANVQVWDQLRSQRQKQKGSPARSLQQMVKMDYESSSKRLKTVPSSSLRCMILIPIVLFHAQIKDTRKSFFHTSLWKRFAQVTCKKTS